MKSKKYIPTLLCLISTSVAAGAGELKAVKELEEMAFASVDVENKGYVGIGAIERYRKLVFFSMDTNEDKKVTEDEYLVWDNGGSLIAESVGKKDAYTAVRKVIFFYRDRNGDGVMTEAEHRNSIIRDFRRADSNGDGLLSKEEFTQQFSELAAIKAGLK